MENKRNFLKNYGLNLLKKLQFESFKKKYKIEIHKLCLYCYFINFKLKVSKKIKNILFITIIYLLKINYYYYYSFLYLNITDNTYKYIFIPSILKWEGWMGCHMKS